MDRIHWNWQEDLSPVTELKDVLAAAKKRSARSRKERVVIIKWQNDEIEVFANSDTDQMAQDWIKKFQDRQKEYQLSPAFIKAEQEDHRKRQAAIRKIIETAETLPPENYLEWFDLIQQFHLEGDRVGLDLTQECRQMADILIKKGFSSREFKSGDYKAHYSYNDVATARFIVARMGLACFEKGKVPRGVPEKMIERYKFLLRGESVKLDQQFRW